MLPFGDAFSPLWAAIGFCVGIVTGIATTAIFVRRKMRIANTQPTGKGTLARKAAPKDFFERATQSHQETRKLVITLAVGSLAVFYATTFPKEPSTDVFAGDLTSKELVALTIVAMAASCASGLLAWEFDARWAYEQGLPAPREPKRMLHFLKNAFYWGQNILFLFGVGWHAG